MRRPFRPEVFQGSLRRRRYFEGWYFKLVFPDEHFALIPGVSLSPGDRHAFVQLIRGGHGRAGYHRVGLSGFRAVHSPFSVTVGESIFSFSHLEVRLPDLTASLAVSQAKGWPRRPLAPNTMGWYSFVPFMQCNHAVLLLDAEVCGMVGETEKHGRLYVEKDFGRSFPSAWLWLQSNSFEEPGVSVTCSIANVPFAGRTLTGVLAGLQLDNALYRFANYTGVRLDRLEVTDRGCRIAVRDRKHRLEIEARTAPGADLRSPDEGVMSGTVRETIDAEVDVALRDRVGTTIFTGTGRRAGLETQHVEDL